MNTLWRLGLASMFLFLLAGCPTEEQTKITPAKSGERTTVVGGVLDRADESVCEQYLVQLNQASMMYQQTNEAFAPDLATVIKESGLPASELQNCKYLYDARTGRVSLAE